MSDVLVDREILLGVSGGVAAWKSADLCSRLVKRGARVSVILTESAHEFIGPATFEALTGRPVHSQQFRAGAFPGRAHWSGVSSSAGGGGPGNGSHAGSSGFGSVR